MKTYITAIIALAIAAPAAHATEYDLRSGSWFVSEGLGIDQASANQTSKTICVRAGETIANETWFIELAKPRDKCSVEVLSQSQSKIDLRFECPMGSADLKGPSTISISSNVITIKNDLSLDLPHAPLPMGQTKTIRHVSHSCASN